MLKSIHIQNLSFGLLSSVLSMSIVLVYSVELHVASRVRRPAVALHGGGTFTSSDEMRAVSTAARQVGAARRRMTCGCVAQPRARRCLHLRLTASKRRVLV
jgi:hypothetical protein